MALTMDPPSEIPKKKLKLDVPVGPTLAKDVKELEDDVVSIESSNLGEDRRILCQVNRLFKHFLLSDSRPLKQVSV